MLKKKTALQSPPRVQTARRAMLEKFADPAALIEQIERKSTGLPPDDPYRARIEELMDRLIDQHGDVDDAGDAKHIRETSAGLTLETASRYTGFVLGFEYCRHLLLGGLGLAAPKGGAA